MKKRVNKRGSHVGMIISFVVFVTFIVFLYTIIKPAITTGQDKKTIADYLTVKIIENVSANFTSTSIEIDSRVHLNKNCIILRDIMTIPELIQSPVPYIKVKNEEGDILPYVYNNYLEHLDTNLKINRDNKDDRFFRIYYSPEFPKLDSDSTLDCKSVEFDDYSISIIKTEKFPFENNLEYLIEHYDEDYEEIKEGLKVPPGTEFGFTFVKSDGTGTPKGEPPSTAEVYATETPIQYIDDYANILSGFINIKVW